jgi:hypothetical protein
MSNKRVLLLTGTTDISRTSTETDNTMEEVFDLTLPSKQRYAKKHGYDLMALRSFGMDSTDKYNIIREKTNVESVYLIRVIRAFEMLSYYDTVMWIDADSIITNDNFSIDDFELDENHAFYASYDWPGRRSFSAGNFIIQNTKHTTDLFNEFMKTLKLMLAQNLGGEQPTLNFLYNTTHKHAIKILEYKFLGGVPDKNLVGSVWDGRPDSPSPWTKDSFIVHLTGMTNKNRIHVMQNSFKEYL